jgi:pimeloyl-ACP methyl ester carboxylesterase
MLMKDHKIKSTEPSCEVVLRNKCLSPDGAAGSRVDNSQSVLFVHGATYASTLTFDYAVDGESWMDKLASEGFDAWCIDLVGYGASDRPASMDAVAEANPPICDTRLAADDVWQAIQYILQLRGTTRLNLLGYSWGTTIAGTVAGEHPDAIARLVLCGALWVAPGSVMKLDPEPPRAYRMLDSHSAARRWTQGLSPTQIDAIAPAERISRWCETAIASDPKSDTHQPPQLRAPTGVIKDYQHYAATGEPWYAPQDILAPTLIVVGEWDKETTLAQCQSVFALLENAPAKRLTVIGEGTHTLLLENQRHQLHQVVRDFLITSYAE